VRAYLAIGSNLGDRWAYLHSALRALETLDADLETSPVYETAPVGGPVDQGAYLNAIVRVDTDLSPRELLEFAQAIESDARRVRDERWGPRTLDVDIVAINGVRVEDEDLVVPHPRMAERAFVLAPLEDLDPTAMPAGWRARLAGQLEDVRRVGYLVCSDAGAGERRSAPESEVEGELVARSRGDLELRLAPARRAGRRIGFVPTLGALHEGHLADIERARAESDVVVVSIFLNPLQFDDRKDLARYPGDVATDVRLAARSGADVVFVPSIEEMYPGGPPEVLVDPGPKARVLEGAARPGHFRGVATVVTKLLAIVRPAAAYFGEKDYQQLVIVRRLVQDLSIPVAIVACPTVREQDGLARSSRNVFLAREARNDASSLYRALRCARDEILSGERDAKRIVAVMTRTIGEAPAVELEYARVVEEGTLEDAVEVKGEVRLLIAARVDGVRLIDNIAVGAITESVPIVDVGVDLAR
jgi:pantoate--beta-alanine ligase